MPAKVVTLGEILLRLSPPNNQKFLQTDRLHIQVGGAEANVAVALSNFGVSSRIISRLPKNDLAQIAINKLRSFGVDTESIARGGDRIGLYFLETGSWARPSKVIYDRADSSVCHARPEDFDFEKIFDGVEWFHTSGITPAISDTAAELTMAALKFAHQKGITTSLDINFRRKLWDEKKARIWLNKLCEYTDVYIGNTGHASLLMDIDAGDIDHYEHVFEELQNRFNFKYIACTIRISHNASLNDFGAIVFDGQKAYRTPLYSVQIVDRVGSGDSFTAGLIYGLLSGKSLSEAADFGVAAAALKHTLPGDLNYLTVEEINSLTKGDVSGQVRR